MRARLVAAALAAAALAVPATARADGDSMRYATEEEPHYFRSLFEIGAILTIGNVDYLLNTTARGGTAHPGDRLWDLRYDWPTFRDKLTGELWRVDTNQFNTNYVSHPLAGALYYTAARGNHLSWLESYAFATLGSFAWEYFAELREVVSVNDAVVTPVAGWALGETSMQLGDFFSRSRGTLPNRALAALFAPLRAINDVADGGKPRRDEDLDGWGLTREVWHRFEIGAGARATIQQGATRDSTLYAAPRLVLDISLVNLPKYEQQGEITRGFNDGNLTRISLDAAWGGGRVTDFSFMARTVPVGLYVHDVHSDGWGGVEGSTGILGLAGVFEYTVHDYDRDGARPLDIVSIVSPVGVYGEYTYRRGWARVRPEVMILGDFAGVTAYGLDAYRSRGGLAVQVPSVLVEKGYYHGVGATASASLALGVGPVEIGGRARVDTIRPLEGYDEKPRAALASISDRRVVGGVWAGVVIPRTGWGIRLDAETRQREGSVGEGRASQDEVAFMGMTSWRF